ncbi:MAG: isochorismatase family protein [Candidatus Obscuribacterales bacterium]|nr:isochorismatase family protein [Candidatus Obscuribacterales bacterium]
MEKYTLVVVDMQPIFHPSKMVIANVAREIELARAADNGIVFLEIPGWGWNDEYPPTYAELTALVRQYPHKKREFKSIANGGPAVLAACQNQKFCHKRFRVCGLHTEACVLGTVEHLLKDAEMVTVVKNACHASRDFEAKCWDLYPQRSNLCFLN